MIAFSLQFIIQKVMWKNTAERYGVITKSLHWLSAITVVALFILGIWMVELDYYSQWYQQAPHLHQSIGVLLFIATLIRIYLRTEQTQPKVIETHSTRVTTNAKIAHLALYILLLTVMSSGYLMSTSDNRAIEIFNWFSVPALGELFANQEDISGVIHEYAAYSLIVVAFIHALAAMKHHIIDKDKTLKRMLY